jgi:O-methyltransferase
MNLTQNNKIVRHLMRAMRKRKFRSIYRKFQKHTMIGPLTFIENIEIIHQSRLIEGAIVECGTWRGGMIGGIASYLGSSREYWLFDSFEGLPKASEEIDGEVAIKWQADKVSMTFHNNCTASESAAREAMNLAGISEPKIIKGWFSETLPTCDFPSGIALLRMDGDWYESTMDILEHLFPKVSYGGLIIVDDYHTWDGCARALHDYLSKYSRTERIREHKGICFLRKDSN